MTLYNDDLQPSGRICPVITFTGASGTTVTTKLGGGDYTVHIYGTSGTSGFASATVTLVATSDDTAAPYVAIRSASGPVTATSDVIHSFTLPKGYGFGATYTGGGATTSISMHIANARPTSTEGV